MQAKQKRLQKRLAILQRKLTTIGPVARGSIVLLRMKSGNKKYPAYYFSVNMNNKTKLIYLGQKKLKIAKIYNDNYLKLWDVINKMTEIVLELIKNS